MAKSNAADHLCGIRYGGGGRFSRPEKPVEGRVAFRYGPAFIEDDRTVKQRRLTNGTGAP